MTYFCPFCFKGIIIGQKICPHCKVNIPLWEKNTSYEEKLIHALDHPIAEVREGVIITLGNLKYKKAAAPLAQCAFNYPADNIQNLEILQSIEQLPLCRERDNAVLLMRTHLSRMIRESALKIPLSKSNI